MHVLSHRHLQQSTSRDDLCLLHLPSQPFMNPFSMLDAPHLFASTINKWHKAAICWERLRHELVPRRLPFCSCSSRFRILEEQSSPSRLPSSTMRPRETWSRCMLVTSWDPEGFHPSDFVHWISRHPILHIRQRPEYEFFIFPHNSV